MNDGTSFEGNTNFFSLSPSRDRLGRGLRVGQVLGHVRPVSEEQIFNDFRVKPFDVLTDSRKPEGELFDDDQGEGLHQENEGEVVHEGGEDGSNAPFVVLGVTQHAEGASPGVGVDAKGRCSIVLDSCTSFNSEQNLKQLKQVKSKMPFAQIPTADINLNL